MFKNRNIKIPLTVQSCGTISVVIYKYIKYILGLLPHCNRQTIKNLFHLMFKPYIRLGICFIYDKKKLAKIAFLTWIGQPRCKKHLPSLLSCKKNAGENLNVTMLINLDFYMGSYNSDNCILIHHNQPYSKDFFLLRCLSFYFLNWASKHAPSTDGYLSSSSDIWC